MKYALWLGMAIIAGVLGLSVVLFVPASVSQKAIQSSVTRTSVLLDRAWQLPVASAFKREVTWQGNLSLCGPASIANVLRSLGKPSTSEADVLAGTGWCRTGYCIFGLSLDELGELARRHTSQTVTVLRDLTPEEFREHLRRANDLGRRYVVNFDRKTIFGAGGGHHSPIGGYLEAEDLAFVLDVNRRFQPWLIERSRLFEAMVTPDGSKKRGLLLIE